MNDETDFTSEGINTTEISVADISPIVISNIEEMERIDAKIQSTLQMAQMAQRSASNAASKSAGWGKKKAAIEANQDAIWNLSNATIANAEAQKELFDNQKKLADISKYLLQLGTLNIASNRAVIKELQASLSGSRGDTLSERTRQEIVAVIQELKSKEDFMQKQVRTEKKVIQTERRVKKLERTLKRIMLCSLVLICCMSFFAFKNRGSVLNYVSNIAVLLRGSSAPVFVPGTAPQEESSMQNVSMHAPTTGSPNQNVPSTTMPDPVSNVNVPTDHSASTTDTVSTSEVKAPNAPVTGLQTPLDADDHPSGSNLVPVQATPENTPPVDNTHNGTTIDEPPVSASQLYAIDTIAYSLSSFRSMVLDNSGNIYYINGDVISRTNSNHTLNLSTSFETPLENAYLAHSPSNNVVYLLADTETSSLAIYDITNMKAPSLILDKTICPAIPGRLAYTSSVVPQIVTLKDGSLLVPIDLNGTHRINPTTKQVTSFSRLYDFSSPYYAKLVGNNIIKLRGDDTKATIIPIAGGNEYNITLTHAAPYNNINTVFSNEDGIFYYEDGTGLCRVSTDGKRHIEIPQGDIQIDDYQSLDRTNIWSLAVSKNGSVAFYDNTLGCIRCIRPLI